MDTAVLALRAGTGLNGQDGILTPLIKQLTEAAMVDELDAHLSAEEATNHKNGSTPKTMNSASGEFKCNTPRTGLVRLSHRSSRDTKPI